MAELNWDKLGMTRSKPSHPRWSEDISRYQQVIDYLSYSLLEYGYEATQCRFDPDLGWWIFYDKDGQILARVEHETVQTVERTFSEIVNRRLDAEVDKLMKERESKPKVSW